MHNKTSLNLPYYNFSHFRQYLDRYFTQMKLTPNKMNTPRSDILNLKVLMTKNLADDILRKILSLLFNDDHIMHDKGILPFISPLCQRAAQRMLTRDFLF